MSNPEINPARTIGRASVESQELFKFLETTAPSQVITYVELSNAAKINVQTTPNVLATARRMMQREHKTAFGTVRGVGIKRLTDEEIPDEASDTVKRAQNVAKKGKKLLGCANYESLSPEAKIRHTPTSTVLSFMEQAGRRKTINLAEQFARTPNTGLNIGDITSLFSKATPTA